jgi:hypothetical protein
LDRNQLWAWQRYGNANGLTAHAAFVSLATKYLQIHPESDVPLSPPLGRFDGDDMSISVCGVPSAIHLAASSPNRAGVTTEIIIQTLVRSHRYQDAPRLVTEFVQFTDQRREINLPFPPGTYALAVRFVDAESGRQTKRRWLDLVTVGI